MISYYRRELIPVSRGPNCRGGVTSVSRVSVCLLLAADGPYLDHEVGPWLAHVNKAHEQWDFYNCASADGRLTLPRTAGRLTLLQTVA